MTENQCCKIDCENTATKKPVIELRCLPFENPVECCIGIHVCDDCANDKAAEELLEGAKTKGMFNDIYRTAKQNKYDAVDWNHSGIKWVSINEEENIYRD